MNNKLIAFTSFFAECKDIISETVYAKSSSVQSQKNSWIK